MRVGWVHALPPIHLDDSYMTRYHLTDHDLCRIQPRRFRIPRPPDPPSAPLRLCASPPRCPGRALATHFPRLSPLACFLRALVEQEGPVLVVRCGEIAAFVRLRGGVGAGAGIEPPRI